MNIVSLIAPASYNVSYDVDVIVVDTTSGEFTDIYLQTVISSNPQKVFTVNDNTGNASVGKIRIHATGGNTINGLNTLILDADNITAQISVCDQNAYIANLSTDTSGTPSTPQTLADTLTLGNIMLDSQRIESSSNHGQLKIHDDLSGLYFFDAIESEIQLNNTRIYIQHDLAIDLASPLVTINGITSVDNLGNFVINQSGTSYISLGIDGANNVIQNLNSLLTDSAIAIELKNNDNTVTTLGLGGTNYGTANSDSFLGIVLDNATILRVGDGDTVLSNGLLIGTLGHVPVIFGTNNTERLRIDPLGNILIDTGNLEVNAGFIQTDTLKNSSTNPVIDLANYRLWDVMAQLSINFDTKQLWDAGTPAISLDWENRKTFDNTGNYTIDWQNKALNSDWIIHGNFDMDAYSILNCRAIGQSAWGIDEFGDGYLASGNISIHTTGTFGIGGYYGVGGANEGAQGDGGLGVTGNMYIGGVGVASIIMFNSGGTQTLTLDPNFNTISNPNGNILIQPFTTLNLNSFSGNVVINDTITTGALIVPKMTTTQRNTLVAISGMIVYDVTLAGFFGYNGAIWTQF